MDPKNNSNEVEAVTPILTTDKQNSLPSSGKRNNRRNNNKDNKSNKPKDNATVRDGMVNIDNTAKDGLKFIKTGLTNIGYNPAGLDVNYNNLTSLRKDDTLALVGPKLKTTNQFLEPIGSKAILVQQLAANLKFVSNTVSTKDEFNDSLNEIDKITASMPKSALKTIFHNYRGLSSDYDYQGGGTVTTNKWFTEDINNVKLSFADTMGTEFKINSFFLDTQQKIPAIEYLIALYDKTLCTAMSLWSVYQQYINYHKYTSKISDSYNFFSNDIRGIVLKSTVMMNSINAFFTSLAEFNLPTKYYNSFVSPIFSMGKYDTSRLSPLEFIRPLLFKVDSKNKLVTSQFKDIYGPTGSKVWTAVDQIAVVQSLMNLIAYYTPVQYENDYLDNKTGTDIRAAAVKLWNEANTQIRKFYRFQLDTIQALQRGVVTGMITCYSNNINVSKNLEIIVSLLNGNELSESSGEDIAYYNLVKYLEFNPNGNGSTVTTPLFLSKTMAPMLLSSGVQMFSGEIDAYEPLYDLSHDVVITLNKPGSKNNIALVTWDSTTSHWQLKIYDKDATEFEVAPGHPIVSLILNRLTPRLKYNMEGGITDEDVIVNDNTYISDGFQYTITTYIDQVERMFKYFSTK